MSQFDIEQMPDTILGLLVMPQQMARDLLHSHVANTAIRPKRSKLIEVEEYES